jgi:cell division protein FtsW
VVAAIMTNDYRQNRVKAFLNPYQDPEGIGFHTIQSLVAIYNGKGVGTGLGEGIQKRGYLPEDRTDYIFAVICEETGIAGAGLVLALFLGLLWAGMSIARSERDPFLRLWSLGIIATIGMQAVMNLLVVTGLAPAKGIALPFVSYGGTGWILTAFSIGVLVAIDRTRAATETSADESPTPLVAA